MISYLRTELTGTPAWNGPRTGSSITQLDSGVMAGPCTNQVGSLQ
jgi:hypothetical protein